MKYTKLRDKLGLQDCITYDESLAYLTHYLQNKESKIFSEKALSYLANNKIKLNEIEWDINFPPPTKSDFTFIDLFAGIGGFRIALQDIGGKCVFSSEFNSSVQKSYELNFGEVPFGDITKLSTDIVPKHDVLCAGFPCQPFSISGKMKGFEDTRGTLIYHVFNIIEAKKPKVVFLENVKHLLYHDKKRTLATIIKHLEELGYKVSKAVLNASNFGVPQNRERIILIGHKNRDFDFSKVEVSTSPVLKDFLEEDANFEYLNEPYTILDNMKSQVSGLIFAGYRNKKIRVAGVRPGTEHLSRVHKQPNRIYSIEGVHPALPSQEVSGRFWIYDGKIVRKLTIKECYRIMGFPDKFKLIESKSELYRQIGNSVCVPMIKEIGLQIKKQLL